MQNCGIFGDDALEIPQSFTNYTVDMMLLQTF